MYIYIYVYIYDYICVYMYTHICVQIIHTHIHILICIHIQKHVYIYIFIYMNLPRINTSTRIFCTVWQIHACCYMSATEPSSWQKQPCTFLPNQDYLEKTAIYLAKELCISAKEPYISAKHSVPHYWHAHALVITVYFTARWRMPSMCDPLTTSAPCWVLRLLWRRLNVVSRASPPIPNFLPQCRRYSGIICDMTHSGWT